MLDRLLAYVALATGKREQFELACVAIAVGVAVLIGVSSWLLARRQGDRRWTWWLALASAHAVPFWIAVGVDELWARESSVGLVVGAGVLSVAAVGLVVAVRWGSRAPLAMKLVAALSGTVFLVVLGLSVAYGMGAFDSAEVAVVGFKGWRGTQHLSEFLAADSFFLRHCGQSATAWRWILRLAAVHALVGVGACSVTLRS